MDDTRNEYAELGQEFSRIVSSESELNRFLSYVLSQFLTPQEAAKQLGVTRGRVQQMLTERKLSYAITPYGRIIPKIALERFKAQRDQENAEKIADWVKSTEGQRALREARAEAERLAQEEAEKLKTEELEKVRQQVREEMNILKRGLPPEHLEWVAQNYARMSEAQRAKLLEEARKNLADTAESEVPQ